ncbi:hypothetical protein C5167_049347 [Papaver somniferum]|uniref:Uncharacterized protein n=1 Tax=Papaver somniferum TaxID=3469 RepID=A0A4Y7KP43_PAPSO|nr:hypothetical protein C5167_049347 [Papaver somniferum]
MSKLLKLVRFPRHPYIIMGYGSCTSNAEDLFHPVLEVKLAVVCFLDGEVCPSSRRSQDGHST